jgi:hypothetical protein
LPRAPSTYRDHVAKRVDPEKLSVRAKRDLKLKPEIERVFAENFEVYGARKVWRQMLREGFVVARCTVQRLMADLGLHGSFSVQFKDIEVHSFRANGAPFIINDLAAECRLECHNGKALWRTSRQSNRWPRNVFARAAQRIAARPRMGDRGETGRADHPLLALIDRFEAPARLHVR